MLISDDGAPKETSRFGTTPVRAIDSETNQAQNSSISRIGNINYNQPYLEGHNMSAYNRVSGKAHDHDGTLSLSFNAHNNESNYYIQSSAKHVENAYQNISKRKRIVKRVKHYESHENDEYGSSAYDTASRNSKGSYKIEYLMHQAFTPIVPSNNHMHEISKISYNRRDLYDNISYSDITDSVLMGRNSILSKKNFTDKSIRKKVLTLSNKHVTMRSKQTFIVSHGVLVNNVV